MKMIPPQVSENNHSVSRCNIKEHDKFDASQTTIYVTDKRKYI